MNVLSKTEELNTIDKERDDALEYYMRRCAQLESDLEKLQDQVKRLKWTLEEHD